MAEGEKEGVREGLICISAGDANCWRPKMMYRINVIKVRTLLRLNQWQSLCIVAMILSVCLFAIN